MQLPEQLLQFIWQHQYFDKSNLRTTNDEPLQIIYPGVWNKDQGPDFLEAKIKNANTAWAGHVEIHIRSSDWNRHGHTGDQHYSNVVLHVVWEEDVDLKLAFPTLELKGRVSNILLQRYSKLMESQSFIPCENQIASVKEIVLDHWKERLLIERLLQKTSGIREQIHQTGFNWENGFWITLAGAFGTPKNTAAFSAMATSLPITILAKHGNQLQQLEALMLGQAGLLEADFVEQYPIMLQKEYQFLKQKHNLRCITHPIQFLRMRPAAFPTIRLAQLAALLHKQGHFFAEIKEANSLESIAALLDVTANDYWLYHYTFDNATDFKAKHLGRQMINSIIINAIVPYVYVYATHHKNKDLQLKLMEWLQKIPAEKNTVTKGFEQLGISNQSAWESQALLQLKKYYCEKKACLSCAVGAALLK